MRRTHVATALVVLTAAGLTASAAIRRIASRRRPATAAVPVDAPAPAPFLVEAPAAVPAPAPATVPERDAVLLPFTRRVTPAPAQPARPAQCGDSGGLTKAGAPCGARAASGGRCYRHPLAA
jgi:hypothetical protein